jgi:wobble nucleotide-excising tRNase
MIESITIKNVASFDNNGIQINNLKKVNFIYGANASGKTTISNYLHNPDDEKFKDKDCSIKWENNQILQILVYNKDFRERNFGNGKIAGVFTLGEATAEQIKKIEIKTQQLKTIKDNGIQKNTTTENKKKEMEILVQKFSNYCWTNIYKHYESEFKEAFKGLMDSKEKFKDRVLHEFSNNIVNSVSYDELLEKSKTIFGEQPTEIVKINEITFDKIVEIENNSIWKKIIVGKADVDIAKLINKLNINDWVNQGRNYLQEDDICPFCQQSTITKDFREQLESFFDESYLNDVKLLKELKLEYNTLLQNAINELNTIETNQKDFKNTKLNVDKFSAYLKTLISQYTTNREYLNNKEKEPSRSLELISLKEQFELIAELITNANIEIQKHNDILENFTTEKSKLIEFIWKFIVEKFKTNISEFNAEKNGLETGIANLNKQLEDERREYTALHTEIKELNKNVTSIQPTIDEINRILKLFGFLNFEIVKAEESNFYQIKREDGTIAEKTLSEGEITFITVLYFLQLAKGGISEETVNNERILIIDDPISSLDSNVLFVVSSLIKEIIKEIKADKGNIKQLILLTHNIYFHKEVSFIDGRTKKCSNTNYWILRKNDKVSTIQSFLTDNPIFSSYELLWRELKSDNIKSCTTIQNIMRRIIEYYFKLLGKYGDDELIKKFATKEEQEICRSLICWINDGSHSVNDDLYIELQDRTVDGYKNVFKEIFNQTKNIGHYNMMMQENDDTEE